MLDQGAAFRALGERLRDERAKTAGAPDQVFEDRHQAREYAREIARGLLLKKSEV